MNKLTYIRCGDYDIPNLKLSEQPETSIGKYGRMRKSYLKEHRPILYNQLLMSEKLYPHLLEIDRTAQERMDTMLPLSGNSEYPFRRRTKRCCCRICHLLSCFYGNNFGSGYHTIPNSDIRKI